MTQYSFQEPQLTDAKLDQIQELFSSIEHDDISDISDISKIQQSIYTFAKKSKYKKYFEQIEKEDRWYLDNLHYRFSYSSSTINEDSKTVEFRIFCSETVSFKYFYASVYLDFGFIPSYVQDKVSIILKSNPYVNYLLYKNKFPCKTVFEILSILGYDNLFTEAIDESNWKCKFEENYEDEMLPNLLIAFVLLRLSKTRLDDLIYLALKGINANKIVYGEIIDHLRDSSIKFPNYTDFLKLPYSYDNLDHNLHLGKLEDLSKQDLPDNSKSIIKKFKTEPRIIYEGEKKLLPSLKKVLKASQQLALHWLFNKDIRTLPEFDSKLKTLFIIQPGFNVSYTPAVYWNSTFLDKDSASFYGAFTEEKRFLGSIVLSNYYSAPHEMFSGTTQTQNIKDADPRIQALYRIWMIATKLVATGNIIPVAVANEYAEEKNPGIMSSIITNFPAFINGNFFDPYKCKPGDFSLNVTPRKYNSIFESDKKTKLYKELQKEDFEFYKDDEFAQKQELPFNKVDSKTKSSIKWFPNINEPTIKKMVSDLGRSSLGLFYDDTVIVRNNYELDMDPIYDNLTAPKYRLRSINPDTFGLMLLNIFISSYLYVAKYEEIVNPEKLNFLFKQAFCFQTTPEEGTRSYGFISKEMQKFVEPFTSKLPQFSALSWKPVLQLEDNGWDKDETLNAIDTSDSSEDVFNFDPHVSLTIAFKKTKIEDGEITTLSDMLNPDYPEPKDYTECFNLALDLLKDNIIPKALLENRAFSIDLNFEELTTFLTTTMKDIAKNQISVMVPKSLSALATPTNVLNLRTGESNSGATSFIDLDSLLEFDWTVAIGDQVFDEKEFEKLLKRAGQLIRIKNNFVFIDPNEGKEILKRMKSKSFNKFSAIRAALAGSLEDAKVNVSDKLQSILKDIFTPVDTTLPKCLTAQLRPYQERGYSWLMHNIKSSMGSIMADDMGLGKTIQVLSTIAKLKEEGELEDKRVLVVVPTTLLINWQRESEKFTHDLSFHVFYNSEKEVDVKSDVLLTTYGTLRSRIKEIGKEKFRLVVADEAQALKNSTTEISKAIRTIKADSFIAMTGTPVENHLIEYWSIMNFVNPGLLGGATQFKKEFATPIEKNRDMDAIDRLKKVTAPFVMRRLKTDKTIISDLPDKISTNMYCTLTPNQVALYQATLDDAMEAISTVSAQDFKRKALILKMMTTLKEVCDTPALVNKVETNSSPLDSGKMEQLFILLEDLFEANRKVLIFTQYAKMGELLQAWINEKFNLDCNFIHGQVSATNRSKMVDRFNTQLEDKALILSLKAAGTGLNLTAATAVIHFDLWWNPAVEEQATDRAYRIGQKHQVDVFRFICANTFEDKIDQMLLKKRELSDLTVTQGETWLSQMDNDELRDVFTLGNLGGD